MDDLTGIEAHWLWIAFGLLLAALEMIVPGTYLLWLAVAAIATGVLTGLFDFSDPAQIITFVSLALIAVFSARRYFQEHKLESQDPLLNRKGARLVGETALVVQAIAHGSGRVHLGDSEWIARGPDAGIGQRVRITGNDGAILLVEPVNLLDAGKPEITP